MLALLLATALAAPCATVADGVLEPSGPIAFAPRTAELKDSEESLASVVCALEADAALELYVGVHSDSRGSSAYNLRISDQRARAIAAALATAGIEEGRLHPAGFGETVPIAPNDTAEGRAANRRIELRTTPFAVDPPAVPEPVPAPTPAPEPTPPQRDPWCVALDEAVAAGEPRSWTREGELEAVGRRMLPCVEAWSISRDGDALYALQEGWLVAVEGVDSPVQVRLERR